MPVLRQGRPSLAGIGGVGDARRVLGNEPCVPGFFFFFPLAIRHDACPRAGEPSPAFAGGIDSGRSGVQFAPPSEVVSSSDLPSTASPTTMPRVAFRKAMQSRNAFGFCSVYCNDQVLPASV